MMGNDKQGGAGAGGNFYILLDKYFNFDLIKYFSSGFVQPPPYPSNPVTGHQQPPPYPSQGYPQQGTQGYPPQPQPFPPMQQQQAGAGQYASAYAGDWKDSENIPENFAGGGFDDKAVRRNFIKRVYSILMVQLVITGAIISLFMFVESLKTYVRYNRWVMWTSWGVALVCIIALACFGSLRRKSPHNVRGSSKIFHRI